MHVRGEAGRGVELVEAAHLVRVRVGVRVGVGVRVRVRVRVRFRVRVRVRVRVLAPLDRGARAEQAAASQLCHGLLCAWEIRGDMRRCTEICGDIGRYA